MRQQRTFSFLILAAMASLVISCKGTSDAAITGMVKTKLAADSKVNASEINVDTANGVVTLTGNIDSQEGKDRAIQLARDTKGVRDVNDMISVKVGAATGDAPSPDRTVGERIDDAGITMRVKAKLLDDPNVKGLKIDVDTRDGVVYLTGAVSGEAERNRAIELARNTEGVKDVQANFQ
ncbi:MAG TPA: BON domain-containing protein [Candidatus Polarisedimenticolia bacterium]|nr:BON domain-containing protein [Candidatus Polarisedimenticolia bacterium]